MFPRKSDVVCKTVAHNVVSHVTDSHSQAAERAIIITLIVTRSFWLGVLSGRETLEAELVLPELQPPRVGKKANPLQW